MARVRLEYLLAGTAITLALALTPYVGSSFAASDADISAAVPMPESADLPPPGIKDLSTRTETSAASPARTEAPADNTAAKPAITATESATAVPATDATKLATAATGDTAVVDKFRDQLSGGKYDRILGG